MRVDWLVCVVVVSYQEYSLTHTTPAIKNTHSLLGSLVSCRVGWLSYHPSLGASLLARSSHARLGAVVRQHQAVASLAEAASLLRQGSSSKSGP